MSIVVHCSHCGAVLKFRDDALGKKAKCTKCKTVVTIAPAREPVKRADDGEAGFLNGLKDAATVAPSQGRRPAARPDPHAESPGTTEPAPVEVAVADELEEKKLMTARPAVRVVVLLVLLIPVAFASRLSVPERLLSCFVPLILTGTYRTSTIRDDRLATRFCFAFYPVVSSRCKLQSVIALNVKYGHVGSGMGTFLLFGPAQVIFGRVFDYLIPAVGGPYQIHLVTAKGRELVAWTGFNDEKFQTTLELLTGLTRAEVRSV
jgi:hypothetical protein